MAEVVLNTGDTALAHGSGDMPILSSSFLITLMESACNSAIAEFLENGETTTLTDMELEIHDALGIGHGSLRRVAEYAVFCSARQVGGFSPPAP